MKPTWPSVQIRALSLALGLIAGVGINGCGGGQVEGDLWGDKGKVSVARNDGGAQGDAGTSDVGRGDVRADASDASADVPRNNDAKDAATSTDNRPATSPEVRADTPTVVDTKPPGPTPWERANSVACKACVMKSIDDGDCDPEAKGCDEGGKNNVRALAAVDNGAAKCKAAYECMINTECGVKGSTTTTCLCGTAMGTACAAEGGANGVCKAEIRAANGAMDGDDIAPGTRYNSLAFPSGWASSRVACMRDFCASACADVPPNGPGEMPPGNDAGAPPPVDTGTPPAVDVGAPPSTDTSTPPVIDVGTPPFTDVGTPPATDAGGPPVGGGLTQGPACGACIAEHLATGDCDAEAAGCSMVTTGAADVALCQAAYDCMATASTPANARCWEGKPVDCLCGSAAGTACVSTAANGVCKAEIRAAAKVASPTDYTAPGTRFFSLAFPIGYASTRIACAHDFCASACAPLVTGGTETPDALPPIPDGGVAADVGGVGPVPPDAAVVPDATVADVVADRAVDTSVTPPVDAGATPPGPDAPVAVTCPDLDSNGKADCQEGLLKNPGFDSNAASWTAEPFSANAFDARNAGASGGSGSLAVTNTNFVTTVKTATMVGSAQCVPVAGGTMLQLYAQTFIPTGQGPGAAGLGGWFFDAVDCTGAAHNAFVGSLITATNTWTVLREPRLAPSNAKSMLIRLVVQKVYDQASLTALFDNVLVRAP